jgi:radical SAM superfamily enzyme YgiQ (UPF0313 family)
MKLLLIQPPIQDFYDTAVRLQPIGLCYLKGAVKKFSPEIEVIIKDYHQGWGRRTIPLPAELAYLRAFYAWPDKSPFSLFYHYRHFGAPFETIADDVSREKPDLVGISSLFSAYHREVLRCAEAIKNRIRVPILVGGSHVSAAPLTMLTHPQIDFVIRGEGERPLVEFLRAWMDGYEWNQVPNLGFKAKREPVLNRMEANYPIDEVPVPDVSDFSPCRYRWGKRPLSIIISSRGCPHGCTFCSTHLTFGTQYRPRSLDGVVQEVKQRYHEGYRVFDFEDDNLAHDGQRMGDLCERLIGAFPSGDVQFLAMNGVSFLNLDEVLLRLMRRAGFIHLNLSLVSMTRTVCSRTKRPHGVEKFEDVVERAHRLGFNVVSYQILGLPHEPRESMIQTLAFLARLPVLVGASVFYLTPGSPISANFPVLRDEDMVRSRLTAMAVETSHCARDDLYTLLVASRIINFLKGIRFEDEVVTLSEALRVVRDRGGRSAFGADLLERLFHERQLCASTKNGLRPIPRFNSTLFFDLWSVLDGIRTQRGNIILT